MFAMILVLQKCTWTLDLWPLDFDYPYNYVIEFPLMEYSGKTDERQANGHMLTDCKGYAVSCCKPSRPPRPISKELHVCQNGNINFYFLAFLTNCTSNISGWTVSMLSRWQTLGSQKKYTMARTVNKTTEQLHYSHWSGWHRKVSLRVTSQRKVMW